MARFKEWGGVLPCTEEALREYLTVCKQNYSSGTVAHIAVSLDNWHIENGYPSILGESLRKEVWDKAQQDKKRRDARPLELLQYEEILKHIEDELEHYEETSECYELAKLQCLMILAWNTGASFDSMKEIQLDDVGIGDKTVSVVIAGKPKILNESKERHGCPVRALKRLIGMRGESPGFLFYSTGNDKEDVSKAMHLTTFRRKLLSLLDSVGIENPTAYNISSIREGRIKLFVEEGYTVKELEATGFFTSHAAANIKHQEYRHGQVRR